MSVECVTLSTNHLFSGNPVIEQHKLRYREIIDRQNWQVPHFKALEYDTYDNVAATYLICRDNTGVARGVSRLYPTDRPYMLQEAFSHMVENMTLPNDPAVMEGSRFCIDRTLEKSERVRIARELILGYLEYGLDHSITHYIGIMWPIFWKNLFLSVGWSVDFLGPDVLVDERRVRAGWVKVSEENLAIVREKSGIHDSVIRYSATDTGITVKKVA